MRTRRPDLLSPANVGRVCLLLLALPLLAPAAAGVEPGQDILGIYFDTAAGGDAVATTEAPQLVTGYLILRNASAVAGVSGWECAVELQGEGVLTMGWELAAGYNFADPPSFLVGIGTFDRLPWAPAIVLATGSFLVTSPAGHGRFYLHPHDPPSLPDTPAPIYAAGNDETDLRPLGWPRGDRALPVAAINPALGGPYCTATPSRLDFGTVVLGQTATAGFLVGNAGGGVVAGSVGAPSNDAFTVIAGGGPYELASGQSHEVLVSFQPQADGEFAAALDACLPVLLQGRGALEAPCRLEPAAIDFGEVTAYSSTYANFTITNASAFPFSGFVASLCSEIEVLAGGGSYTLVPGQQRPVTLLLRPVTVGPFSCEIAVGGECSTLPCQAVVVEAPPACLVSPAALDFGRVAVGGHADRQFSFWNSGGGLLEGEVAADCEHFAILSGAGPFSLAHGHTRDVVVRYAPQTHDAHTCAVTFGESGCGPVICSGVAPLCSVTPDTLDFGIVDRYTSADLAFTIANPGGAPISGEVAESCARFSLVAGGGAFTLAPGEQRIVVVRFLAEVAGTFTCVVTTGTDCADVFCRAVAVEPPPLCAISPPALEFGVVNVGASVERSFTITNTGGGLLQGAVSSPCPEFAVIQGGGGYALAHNSSRIVRVRFTPAQDGPRSCEIATGGACAVVPCSGTGVGPFCAITPASLDFGQVRVGASRELTFVVRNVGGGWLDGQPSADCAAYAIVAGGEPFHLGPGQTRLVTVRFAPQTTGEHVCDVSPGADCAPVHCTGTGADPPPGCWLEPAQLDFGALQPGPGQTRDLVFTINNGGPDMVSGDVQAACEHFALIAGAGPFTLAPGEVRPVTVRYAPSAYGQHACAVQIGTDCGQILCTGSFGPATSEDVLGVYFDTAGQNNHIWTTQPFEPVRAYLILKNASQPSGVGGWECCVEMVGPSTGMSWTVAGGGTNFLQAPCFAVGYGVVPPPWSPAIVLAWVDFVQPAPWDATLFFLHPTPIPSLPGQMVYAAAHDPFLLVPMQWSSGGEIFPVAFVNDNGMVPLAAPAPEAQVAGRLVTLSWTCDDPSVEGFHVYRRHAAGGGGDGGGGEAARLTAQPLPRLAARCLYNDDVGALPAAAVLRYHYTLLRGGQEVARSPETAVALGGGVPAAFALHPPRPNPFNPFVTVAFDVPHPCRARLEVYDAAGRRLRVLAEGDLDAGRHERLWDGRDAAGRAVSSGTYYCRLSAAGFATLRTMTLLK